MPNRFDLLDFAERYTAAWCSRDASSVAAFFEPNGSLTINEGPPSVGREAITATVRGFMIAFPDLKITLDGASLQGERSIYRWTFEGTNTGPGGTGAYIRISGHEDWEIGNDGLIATSLGHFDAADYQRQFECRR